MKPLRCILGFHKILWTLKPKEKMWCSRCDKIFLEGKQ